MACACKGTIGFLSQRTVSKCSAFPGRIVSVSALRKLDEISPVSRVFPYQRFRHFSISTTRWSIVATGSSSQDVRVEPILNHGQDEGRYKHDEDSATSSSSESSEDEESSGFKNEHLIKLSPLQRAIITIGSGLSSFFDPTRAGWHLKLLNWNWFVLQYFLKLF